MSEQQPPPDGVSSATTMSFSNKGTIKSVYQAPIIKSIALGSCSRVNHGCPSTWTYQNGKCYEPSSCYCQCTSGKHRGFKYKSHLSWGFNCLDLISHLPLRTIRSDIQSAQTKRTKRTGND